MVKPAHIVHGSPDILGGTVVFVGTRVPVRSLFDYLEGDKAPSARETAEAWRPALSISRVTTGS